MPPRDLNELDEAEARAYLEAYLEAAPERLAWLERKLAATGGPPPETLDRSPESLVPLWSWFVSWYDGHASDAEDAENAEDVPMWYERDPPGRTALSPEILRVVDGLGYYLAEVLSANVPGARWAVAESPKRLRLDDRNKPVLKGETGARVSPVDVVYTGAAKVAFFGTGREDDGLAKPYRIWEEALRGGKGV